MKTDVLVVIGVGGMGSAIARRMGPGKTVLLADIDMGRLEPVADELVDDGYEVRTSHVDVSSRESVAALADKAASLGAVLQVAHTAGLSPAQAPADAILRVDLLGVAISLQEFGRVIAEGGAGLVVSSMAGHLAAPLSDDQQAQLAGLAAEDLLGLPFLDPSVVNHPGIAYALAKRGNHLRVQAASGRWGQRGARINSISPGIISTSMGRQELSSETGEAMRSMIAMSAAKRVGTAEDIAAAASFLLGSESSFVTGTDLLVDGGVVAAIRSA